jgi:tetratricopeptide (TPR) repeat protein
MRPAKSKKVSGMLIILLFFSFEWACKAQGPGTCFARRSPSQAGAVTAARGSDLVPVPYPDLSKTEAIVKEQIEAARSNLQSNLQNSRPAAAEMAQAYGKLGELYHAYDFPDAATACYKNAHALSTQEFRWPYLLGRLYQIMGDHQSAVTYLRMAQQLRPNEIPVQLSLAETYLDENHPELAKPLFEKVLELDKSSAAAMVKLGKIALSTGNAAEAVKYYEAALSVQPEASSIHYSLAMAYRRLGDMPKALAHLQQSGSEKPKVADPFLDEMEELNKSRMFLWMRGEEARRKGRFTEAVDDYRQIVERNKEDPLARIALGSALAEAGDLKGAIEQYTEALSLSPGNDTAHYDLGLVLIENKSEQEAMEHFRAAIELNPRLELAHFQLANLLMRNGGYDEAARQYSAVLKMDPSHEFARLMESMALIRLKRYSEAEARLEEGLGVLPDSIDLEEALARLLAACPEQKVRDGQRSLKLLQRILEVQKSPDLEVIETLAMALAEVGKFSEATRIQTQMVGALERSNRPDLAEQERANVVSYEQGHACRIPWRDDDPVFSPQPGKLTLMVRTILSRMAR